MNHDYQYGIVLGKSQPWYSNSSFYCEILWYLFLQYGFFTSDTIDPNRDAQAEDRTARKSYSTIVNSE
jgi:hypothetical protein